MQPREHDQHTLGDRQRATRQAGAGPARDQWNLGLVARSDHAVDLLGAAGKHRRDGDLAVVRQAVRAIRGQLMGVRQHVLVAADRLQLGDELQAGGKLRSAA